MNNKEFITALSLSTGYSTSDTTRMVNNVVTNMSDGFMNGDSLNIPDFGTFEVKKKLERVIVNPGTKKRMLVPPKLVLSFRQNAKIKNKVNDHGKD